MRRASTISSGVEWPPFLRRYQAARAVLTLGARLKLMCRSFLYTEVYHQSGVVPLLFDEFTTEVKPRRVLDYLHIYHGLARTYPLGNALHVLCAAYLGFR